VAELQERIAKELLVATKARDSVRMSTLRLLISAYRYKEVEKKKTLGDSDFLEVIQTEAKRRRESIDQYTQAARPDLAAKEKAELDILAAYLPQAMSDSELEVLVRESIAASGAKGPQDVGRVMGQLMPKIKGRADGKQAQELVKKLLV